MQRQMYCVVVNERTVGRFANENAAKQRLRFEESLAAYGVRTGIKVETQPAYRRVRKPASR